jgi:hypothetical protein
MTPLTTAGQIYSVIAVPTTADVAAFARRIGDAITVTGLELSVVIRGAETGTLLVADSYNNVGMRLAWVNNPNGAGLPSGVANSKNAFFDTGGYSVSDAVALLPPLGFDIRPDVTVVQDKIFTVSGLDTSALGVVNVKDHTASYHRKFKFNKRVIFNSTTNASTATEKGLLVLAFIGDSTVTPSPLVSWHARVFYDM